MRFNKGQLAANRELERRWEKAGLENLSPHERKFIALFALEGDVLNGGLSQYFFNSSGDLALEALAALDELDARQTHRALASAIKKIWPEDYPVDRAERFDALVAAEDADETFLDDETRIIQEPEKDFLALMLDRLQKEYSIEN